MAEESPNVRINQEHRATGSREQSAFVEAHGEAEPDAVRDVVLNHVEGGPTSLASVLRTSDASTRARIVSRLQQERGNAYVERILQRRIANTDHGPRAEVRVQR